MTFDRICRMDLGKKPFGSLKWGRDGLKTVFRAESFALQSGIYRVYAYSFNSPEKKFLIGVLAPEGECLCLNKSFSDNDLRTKGFSPDEIDSAEAVLCGENELKAQPDMIKWDLVSPRNIGLRDDILLKSIGDRQVLLKNDNGRIFIAEEIKYREELMTVPALSLATFIKLDKKWYVVFEVTGGLIKKAADIHF